MNLAAPWSEIGSVDIRAALESLAEADGWNHPAYDDVPSRIFNVAGSFSQVIRQVLAYFSGACGGLRTRDTLLSRMLPGQVHGMHVDQQTPDLFVTRVHVPLLTNPLAWMHFEEQPERVHFEAGKAYTFDTNRRHSFGNDGPTARVHLIFDVVR